jgi:hypothetical protein
MTEDLLEGEIIVFEFTFIDNPEYFQKPEDYISNPNDRKAVIAKVEAAFKKSGWEGDGEIGLIWIPPFMYNPALDEDPGQLFGTLVWHVKQYNNGISFLGFYKDDLNYISKRSLLAQQNDGFFDPERVKERNHA